MEMYFIALIPPDEITNKVLNWKLWMKENHGCEVALRSTAHVTLVPPFRVKSETENEIIETLGQFASRQDNFLIRLRNFSHFKSRSIYIQVQENPELIHMRNNLLNFLQQKNKLPIPDKEERFTAHITIATRDLDKNRFQKAWEYFKEISYEAEWNCRNISLLRHNKKNWDVISTSQFRN